MHLNFWVAPEPSGFDRQTLPEDERIGAERGDEFMKSGAAYAQMQDTRPSTLGFALASSPLALLAW